MDDPLSEVAAMRRDYRARGLERKDLDPDPITQFRKWFQEAIDANLLEPNAMTLSTADRAGRVLARTVLLKAFDNRGFVFYTSYKSRKAEDIAENPQVALLFTWLPLERQICITGRAEKISKRESLAYFLSRPFGNRLGAWVSQQSKVIPSRRVIEQKFEEMKRKFASGEVPLPDAWGGYCVAPGTIEFWQGSESRLHDRFLYTRQPEGDWAVERLSP